MKKFLLLCGVLLLPLLSVRSQVTVDTVFKQEKGTEYLLIEKNPVSELAINADANLTANHACYRLFVVLKTDYKFLACGGLDNTTPYTYVLIESTSPFYNDTIFGTETGKGANPLLYGVYPNLEYDSYAADGRIGTSYVGVLKSINSTGYVSLTASTTPAADLVIPTPISTFSDNKTTRIYDYNTGWVVPGAISGPDEAINTIFIGQFTTAGELHLNLTISSQTPYKEIRYAKNIAYGYTPEPTVNLLAPVDGSFIVKDSVVAISVTAKDYDGTVDSLEFFINNEKIYSKVKQEYIDFPDTVSYSWNFGTTGKQTVKVIATDNTGNTSADSAVVTVISGTAPTVSISQPANGAQIHLDTTLYIIANAADADGTIDSVEFFINDTKIGTVSSAPYQISWTAAAIGAYNIKARATDNDTISNTSETITFDVVKGSSSVNNTNTDFDIVVYPNPVQNILTISFAAHTVNGLYQFQIFDITGGHTLQQEISVNSPAHFLQEIDVTSLKPGIYILKISTPEKRFIYKKFSKN